MKQKIFTLLLISAIGLVSCRKDKVEQNIKQYDDSQIQNYISVHGITGMLKDPTGGDTTGMYYKLILPGNTTLTPLDYPDKVSYVFTLSSLDGKYISADTIQNHEEDYLGHLVNDGLPAGLQLAIKNLLKYPGASMRLLIPSHLAYGVNGYGSGSSTIANSKIAGNQSLDYYVHTIDITTPAGYQVYDTQVISNYFKNNNINISDYTKTESIAYPGNFYYYKVLTKGTGVTPITDNSTVTVTYTGSLLNGTVFDGAYNGSNTTELTIADLTSGVKEALEKAAVTGTKISIIVPSALAYGSTTSGSIPINSCLRFTFQIVDVQ